ncbi:winged helix-turn-helix domain-containing protein [Enterobacter hormaechei]|uniref:winged helix-turn-helix domain-containing protein n=1 Tax=Enterobacter hormaechei TaxID=158836 RepID=UPI00217600E7|nr:hypothetical protein [Enterobacter hormaechei]UVZ93280.1 hypothetical protein M5T14_22290 [Enterobacter hormaechei]
MRYLINNLIIYDVNTKTLTNKNYVEDSIELTPGSVAVLLDFFISYPHKVWTKAEIGEKAFSSSPYSGTESNINKSLSLLRRSFKDVGEDSNIISTLSTLGVVFNASVVPYEMESTPLPLADKPAKLSLIHLRLKTILFAVGGGILISCFLLYYFLSEHKKQTECVFEIKAGNKQDYSTYVENVIEFKTCKAPGVIISNVQNKSAFKNNYSLVAKCDSEESECFNLIKK